MEETREADKQEKTLEEAFRELDALSGGWRREAFLWKSPFRSINRAWIF